MCLTSQMANCCMPTDNKVVLYRVVLYTVTAVKHHSQCPWPAKPPWSEWTAMKTETVILTVSEIDSMKHGQWTVSPDTESCADSIPHKSPPDETINRGSVCTRMQKKRSHTQVSDPVLHCQSSVDYGNTNIHSLHRSDKIIDLMIVVA